VLAGADPAAWSQVGPGEIFVSDVIDQATAPDAKMTVGFARVGAGERLEISFPHDEVLILTKGIYAVRAEDGAEHTARAGEVIHLPGGSRNVLRAVEDTAMVYVASPPWVYAGHVAATAAES